tara:strand:+ start:7082 stop:8299 length:1218 start_codon:yes stop_codon:yes gene_type:complete
MWQDWDFVNALGSKKKIVLFGRSEDWLPRFIRKFYGKIYCICDSDKSLDGKKFFNIKIIHKSKLLHRKDLFFIITSGSFRSIASELLSHKKKPNLDFVCSPDFKDFQDLIKMRSLKGKFILSSSDRNQKQKVNRSSSIGGGIFILEFNETKINLKKKLKGSFRQLCKYEGKFAAVNENGEIVIFDKNIKVIKKFKTKINNLCGIDFHKKTKSFIITNQTRDKIYIFDITKKEIINEIPFSDLSGEHLKSPHHINDIFINDDDVYLTFFSWVGDWKNGVYDGGIAKFNIYKKKIKLISKKIFWQPHSPTFIDGELACVDSGNGRIVFNNHKKEIKLNGFVRGLKKIGKYIICGQSETMYLSRMIKKENLINITPGLYIIDINKNANKFIPVYGLCNIHDIEPLSLI